MGNPFFSYYLIIIVFTLYFSISYLFKLLKINNLEKALQKQHGLTLLNLRHIIGILLFGVTFLCLDTNYFALLTSFHHYTLNVTLISLMLIILTIVISRSSVLKTIAQYSSNDKPFLGNGVLYFTLRVIFLLSYELFFRGILLFTLIDVFGLISAIIINTLLYVIIHAFDSKSEIIGAIPFGVVLCLISYYSQSVILAFILHLSLSLVYEISLFKFFNRIKLQS